LPSLFFSSFISFFLISLLLTTFFGVSEGLLFGLSTFGLTLFSGSVLFLLSFLDEEGSIFGFSF
jgi:hypothetical protein